VRFRPEARDGEVEGVMATLGLDRCTVSGGRMIVELRSKPSAADHAIDGVIGVRSG
jgi:hypothetical protein